MLSSIQQLHFQGGFDTEVDAANDHVSDMEIDNTSGI